MNQFHINYNNIIILNNIYIYQSIYIYIEPYILMLTWQNPSILYIIIYISSELCVSVFKHGVNTVLTPCSSHRPIKGKILKYSLFSTPVNPILTQSPHQHRALELTHWPVYIYYLSIHTIIIICDRRAVIFLPPPRGGRDPLPQLRDDTPPPQLNDIFYVS